MSGWSQSLFEKAWLGLILLFLLGNPSFAKGGEFFLETLSAEGGILASNFWHLERIKASEALSWACGEGVWVVLVDTGVDPEHPALAGHLLLDLARNFGDENSNEIYDSLGHGTQMAGLILQVAPCAQIIPLKINQGDSPHFSNQAVEMALEYVLTLRAEHPEVKIVNLSLAMDFDPLVQAEIAALAAQGVWIPAASGNYGGNWISFPASLRETIAVSATDKNDQLLEGANYGPALTIVAPGEDLWAPFPGDLYLPLTGTSGATALVSGALALLAEIDSSKARWALVVGSQDLDSPGHDVFTGFGLLQVNEAASRLRQADFYFLPTQILLRPGQEGYLYFYPPSLALQETRAPVRTSLVAPGTLQVEALTEGEGALTFCQEDRCQEIPVKVTSEATEALSLLPYPYRFARAGYFFYAFETTKNFAASVKVWVTSWKDGGFVQEPWGEESVLQWPAGFYCGELFPHPQLQNLRPGLYEVGVLWRRDDLSRWQRTIVEVY